MTILLEIFAIALFAVAVSRVALSLGAAIVWYARAEAYGAGTVDWAVDGLFGPIRRAAP